MKIIIAGDGKVGQVLAGKLSAEGHDITLIDQNPKVLEASLGKNDLMAMQGNCASIETLEEAGAKKADLLIAATGADEINLLCCLSAHKLNPSLHAIARIRNPEYSNHIYQMKDIFALSMAVNPERLAATEIERMLRYPAFLQRDSFAKGRASLVELEITKDNPICGQPLMKLGKIVTCKVLVCSVLRDGQAFTPGGTFILEEGDRVFVTASTDNLVTMLRNFGIITKRIKSVMICGGGRISYYLAQLLLKSGIDVTIIEQKQERCEYLAGELPKANIVCGDASNHALLESESLEKYDALVTLTGLDEVNLLLSLYGHNKKIPKIVTKLGRMESRQILTGLPIGSVVNTQELCSELIVSYIRALNNTSGAAVAVHSIADGQAEAAEYRIDKTCKYQGTPLKDIPLKKHVLIACVIHDRLIQVADGNTTFAEGDSVIVISNTDNLISKFNDIFKE